MINVDMTVDEALAFTDTESKGHTFYPGKRGLVVTCAVLAEEVRRLRGWKWIDVKDDLPANGEDVLCLLKTTVNGEKNTQVVGHIEDGSWFDSWLDEEIENTWFEVAGWTPLQKGG